MKKIIAFSGSNSSESVNQELIRLTSQMVDQNEVEVLDIRDYEAPVYGMDLEKEKGIPPSMRALSKKLDEADAFIVSSPEHNGSMPAVLKNTIDWLSRINMKPFGEKPTVFMAASPGPRGGASALEHLIHIMPHRGAKVVGQYSLASFYDKVQQHHLTPGVEQDIKQLVRTLEEQLI